MHVEKVFKQVYFPETGMNVKEKPWNQHYHIVSQCLLKRFSYTYWHSKQKTLLVLRKEDYRKYHLRKKKRVPWCFSYQVFWHWTVQLNQKFLQLHPFSDLFRPSTLIPRWTASLLLRSFHPSPVSQGRPLWFSRERTTGPEFKTEWGWEPKLRLGSFLPKKMGVKKKM